MNKTELVETIAQRTDLSKKDVDAVLGAFWDIIAQTVAKGKDTVTIPGWIKFEQVTRDPRVVRNPQTGEQMKIGKTKAVKITAGATLKAIAKGDKPAPK
ncbi:MAG: HU family DNA-binding protein [Microthrixaceae bacterium]|nr:HU family DNA-binding protein [Microthrixaceae bacterium]MCO5313746.1 HU family DNA-binding protein [Microthrixaceae bacterium]HPB45526.1 HU family DNA-binding protein [Microthrixaceae bacterium]